MCDLLSSEWPGTRAAELLHVGDAFLRSTFWHEYLHQTAFISRLATPASSPRHTAHLVGTLPLPQMLDLPRPPAACTVGNTMQGFTP